MTYDQEFALRMQHIEARALAAGTTMTELCRLSGIARSTPDRWKTHTPKTVRVVAELEKWLGVKEAGAVAGASDAA